MDCVYVAHQRMFVANRPEDLAHYPIVSSHSSQDQQASPICQSLTATLTLTTNSLTASCLPNEDSGELLSPESSSSSSSKTSCRCIIDLSSTESLRRDFYDWLQGNELDRSRDRPCVFDDSTSSTLFCDPSTSALNSATAYIFNSQPLFAPQVKRQRQRRVVEETQNMESSDLCVPAEKPKKKRGGSNRGTNLYGRAYCPGRPLSMEERYQIICLFQSGMKVNAISKDLRISHGCVSKIITRYRETGLLIPSSHAECRRRKRMLMEAAQQQSQQTTD